MRVRLLAATIVLLVVLGSQPAAWGQAQSGGSATGSVSFGQGGQASGGGGGAGSPLVQRGQRETVGPSLQNVQEMMSVMGAELSTGQPGRGRQNMMQQLWIGGGQAGRGGGGGRTTRTEVRTSLRLGFRPSLPTTVQRGSRLVERLTTSPRIRSRSPMEVVVQEQTAILRGAVATDHDRRLAERLAMLEPGIRRVQNELTLAPSAEAPDLPAATP